MSSVSTGTRASILSIPSTYRGLTTKFPVLVNAVIQKPVDEFFVLKLIDLL